MSYSRMWRSLLLLLSLCAAGYLIHAMHLAEMLDSNWMDHWVRGRGFRGEVLFLGVGALATAVGVPRQVVAFLAGYSSGLILGILLGVLATVFGAAMAFWYARLLGRDFIARRFPGQVARLDEFTRDDPFLKTLAIRLLPVGNNLLTCLVAGVSRISAVSFLLGSALGYLPQTLIFALAGSGVTIDSGSRIGASVALFLISGIINFRWYRQLRASHAGTLPDLDASPLTPVVRGN